MWISRSSQSPVQIGGDIERLSTQRYRDLSALAAPNVGQSIVSSCDLRLALNKAGGDIWILARPRLQDQEAEFAFHERLVNFFLGHDINVARELNKEADERDVGLVCGLEDNVGSQVAPRAGFQLNPCLSLLTKA